MNLKEITREGTDQIQEGFQWGWGIYARHNEPVGFIRGRGEDSSSGQQFLKKGSNP
jgi:hypothetical protein